MSHRGQNSIQSPALAVWLYSVLRKPGLVLIKDRKMKIYSIAASRIKK